MMLDCIVDKEQAYGAQRAPNGFQVADTLARQRSLASYQAPSCAPDSAGGGNELIGYYFGSISRETAEWILRAHGNQADGAYLLRSSGPSDDFVLSLLVDHGHTPATQKGPQQQQQQQLEVLHYKIVETEDSFVALHGQVGDEKFATIDELIDKAQGVATKPRWPVLRHSLDSHILPPTFWGLSVEQVRWAILIKARQWGFPLAAHLFQQQAPASSDSAVPRQVAPGQQQAANGAPQDTTLNNETIRTLIHKSLHEFQPWFHGKISREEAERRVEDYSCGWAPRDGRFLVRERDNYSYAMCISHRNTTKHYRIDVLPTGELAIQDGRKFTSLMALVSHYTITNDGLWCALTEACPRPIAAATQVLPVAQPAASVGYQPLAGRPLCKLDAAPQQMVCQHNGLCCGGPPLLLMDRPMVSGCTNGTGEQPASNNNNKSAGFICAQQGSMASLKAPIKEWLQAINHRWSQLVASQRHQHHSGASPLNSFLFGHQNPLNNHCDGRRRRAHRRAYLSTAGPGGAAPVQQAAARRKCKNGHLSCACLHQQQQQQLVAAHRQQALQMQASTNGSISTNSLPACKVIASELAACETMAGRLQLGASDVSNAHNRANSNCASYLSASTGAGELVAGTNFPQLNSGFALNGQSFVGSPLFAVQASGQQFQQVSRQLGRAGGGGGGGSSSSGGSGASAAGGDNASELAHGDSARLISPIQSVCGSSQLQQNTVDQIYDSSRACPAAGLIGSDKRGQVAAKCSSLTSSQSVASSQQLVHSHYGGSTASTLQACSQLGAQLVYRHLDRNRPQQQILHHQQQQQQYPHKQVSPIVCGQHAGPAFRYTNCQSQSLRPCAHHRPTAKALDDLQLPTGCSPLAAPAAMTRFVQFQDGQCLRTHRDTQSIQQAYLWAARQHHSPRAQAAARQVPLAAMAAGGACAGRPEPIYGNPGAKGVALQQQAALKPADAKQEEVDLMYCGEDSNEHDYLLQHHFKYDPRQIKSSSIETLCGVGVDKEDGVEEQEAHFDNSKSNSELIMSLHSYWSQAAPQQVAHLSPIAQPIRESARGPQQADSSTGVASALAVGSSELLESQLRKKHDLDELTTTVLAELDASLKAQVELKNRRAGFCPLTAARASETNNQPPPHPAPANAAGQAQPQAASSLAAAAAAATTTAAPAQVNPLELINEFDTLISNNR